MNKAPVADANEILEALTAVMRKQVDCKTNEVLRAAELLGRWYGLFGESEVADEPSMIVIDLPWTSALHAANQAQAMASAQQEGQQEAAR